MTNAGFDAAVSSTPPKISLQLVRLNILYTPLSDDVTLC